MAHRQWVLTHWHRVQIQQQLALVIKPGEGAKATGNSSAAIGSGALATGDNPAAIGKGAEATNENAAAGWWC